MSDKELVACYGALMWNSPVFKDTVSYDGIMPTLLAVPHGCVILGYLDHGTGKHQSNTVYSTQGVAPAITTIDGGTQQIKVLVDG